VRPLDTIQVTVRWRSKARGRPTTRRWSSSSASWRGPSGSRGIQWC